MSLTLITRARASALLFGGVALSAIRSPERAPSATTLCLAITPIEGAAEVYYAEDMGFFGKAGFDADVQAVRNSNATALAIASGEVDIGYNTLDTLGLEHQKKIPVVVIAPAAEYVSPARIVALVLTGEFPG